MFVDKQHQIVIFEIVNFQTFQMATTLAKSIQEIYFYKVSMTYVHAQDDTVSSCAFT